MLLCMEQMGLEDVHLNTTEQVLLCLIKESLFGVQGVYPKDTNWNAVLNEAQDQVIDGLIYNTYIKDYVQQEKSNKYQLVANWIKNLYVQQELVKLLAKHNISSAILKGTAAAIYYPHPFYRRMGDIDIIVPKEEFNAATSVLEKNGYVCKSKDYVRHFEYYKDGIEIELHRYFTKNIQKEKYITQGLANVEIVEMNEFKFPMLPPLENGLVLLEHLRFHLVSGLGIRQVIDWMMYVDKVLNDEFWYMSFKKMVVDVGLDTLAITMTRMCQIYLGLNESITWCKTADEKLCRRLMDIVLSSGNFGRKQGEGKRVESVAMEYKKGHFFQFLQENGEQTWLAYKNHAWLKPFCWIYQICRLCRHGFSAKRGNKLISDIKRGRERLDIMKEMNIE